VAFRALAPNFPALKRKKGRGLPLSGTCPAVSADKLPCFKFSLKGRSDFAVQAGADLASQLAQNLAEAFLWRRTSDWVRQLRSRVTQRDEATFYATII